MKQNENVPITIITELRSRKPMLTTTELMALLRVTRGTLCGWARKGLVPSTRLPDNSYLFDIPARLPDGSTSAPCESNIGVHLHKEK